MVRTSPVIQSLKALPPVQRCKADPWSLSYAIPHASGPKPQSIRHKQYCNKFDKGFIKGLHQKNLLKNRWPKMHTHNIIYIMHVNIILYVIYKCSFH